MSKKKINFMGLLANVDSSILNVKLDHGFKIKAMHRDVGIKLISHLESVSPNGIFEKLWKINCINKDNIFYIDYSFESNIVTDENGRIIDSIDAENKTESTDGNVHTYLIPTIRLMKLFKEGNVSMPFRYLYFIDNHLPKPIEMTMNNLYIRPELYSIESSEISDLQKFIHDIRIPFKENYIQLAFENFELSYYVHNLNLSFLSLMISLETLFHPGDRDELSYRISRNASVLLGNDEEDSENIYRKIKNDLYNKRSKLVHSGKSNINMDDVLKLRGYVRESIKKIYTIGKPKDDLLKILHSSGFYQKQKDIKT